MPSGRARAVLTLCKPDTKMADFQPLLMSGVFYFFIFNVTHLHQTCATPVPLNDRTKIKHLVIPSTNHLCLIER